MELVSLIMSAEKNCKLLLKNKFKRTKFSMKKLPKIKAKNHIRKNFPQCTPHFFYDAVANFYTNATGGEITVPNYFKTKFDHLLSLAEFVFFFRYSMATRLYFVRTSLARKITTANKYGNKQNDKCVNVLVCAIPRNKA